MSLEVGIIRMEILLLGRVGAWEREGQYQQEQEFILALLTCMSFYFEQGNISLQHQNDSQCIPKLGNSVCSRTKWC